MSQRVGDFGSELMSCENDSEIKKYGSQQACMEAKLSPNKKKSQKMVNNILCMSYSSSGIFRIQKI